MLTENLEVEVCVWDCVGGGRGESVWDYACERGLHRSKYFLIYWCFLWKRLLVHRPPLGKQNWVDFIIGHESQATSCLILTCATPGSSHLEMETSRTFWFFLMQQRYLEPSSFWLWERAASPHTRTKLGRFLSWCFRIVLNSFLATGPREPNVTDSLYNLRRPQIC